mgnify:FL=1
MSFLDKMKEAIGIQDAEYEDDYYYDDDYDEDLDYTADHNISDDFNNTEYKEENEVNKVTEQRSTRRNNVTDISSSKVKISIQEPLTYDDGPYILNDIMNRKVVILNLEMLEVDKKRQIFDFVSGGIYSLDGDISKVTKDIFVIAPRGIEIEGELQEQLKNKSLYQL